MSTRKGQFVAVVVTFLFVFISCASLEKSDQHFSRKGSKRCLRRCLRRQEHNATRLSPCYHKCLYKKNKGPAQHHGLYSKIVNQRTRRIIALPHNYHCPDSSPSQTVDWSPQQINVSFGEYENTSHWYVNVSWTPMNDTQGTWNATMVLLIVSSSRSSRTDPVNCLVHPKNQTFLQLNLSLYHYQYPNSIFVRILGLPYTVYTDDSSPTLTPFTPPIPSTSPSTSRPKSACSRREYSDLLWYPAKVDVHFLQRETKEWYANISWTPLADPTVSWKGYWVVILSRKLECFKIPKNQTFVIVDSSNGWEYPNELSLNVSAFPSPRTKEEDFTTFYPVKITPPPRSSSACISPPTSPPKSDMPTTSSMTVQGIFTTTSTSEKPLKMAKIVLPIAAGVVIALVLLLLYQWWRQKDDKNDVIKTFKYHAFLIYNMCDADEVNTILSVLEDYGLKCCIHWRNFTPGKPYVDNIVDSVDNSFKVIAILSRSSFPSECLTFEIQQTLTRLMNNGDDCLILIALDRDVVSNLPQAVKDRSYIDFTEITYRSNWETRLVEILRKGVVEEDDSVSDTASSGSSTGGEGAALLQL